MSTIFTGFEIRTIGTFYNMFQTPLFKSENEAKDFLIDYLGIQKIHGKRTLYAGKKDERKVILMRMDAPTELRDLTKLYGGAFEAFYDAWDRLIAKNPEAPVEKILLVCMNSHHPHLADALQNKIPYPLDIEVLDVDFEEFRNAVKPPLSAEFSCGQKQEDGELDFGGEWLIVENFYPNYLLSKFGYTKDDMPDWRKFCSAIYIDFNFNTESGVANFTCFDFAIVTGQYEIPKTAGDTFLVKIVDLIDEPIYSVITTD